MNIQALTNNSREFFGWWLSELQGILPTNKSMAGKLSQRGLTVVLEEKNSSLQWDNGDKIEALGRKFSSAVATDAYQKVISRDKKLKANVCNVQLPAKRILRRTITLPANTEENLENVVAYEMDRYTPFSKDDVYFDAKVEKRDKQEGKIGVLLSVVKKDVLDEIITFANDSAISIQNIYILSKDAKDGHESFNFTHEHQSAAKQQGSSKVSKFLFYIALVLAITALALPIAKNYWIAEQYKAQLAEIKDDVIDARNLQSEYKTIKKDVDFIANQKANSAQVLDLLNELTKIIPNDTSLARFSLEEESIRIRGSSSSASRLISIIDSSSSFTDVRFVAPVTQSNKTGKESFTIQFAVEEGE